MKDIASKLLPVFAIMALGVTIYHWISIQGESGGSEGQEVSLVQIRTGNSEEKITPVTPDLQELLNRVLSNQDVEELVANSSDDTLKQLFFLLIKREKSADEFLSYWAVLRPGSVIAVLRQHLSDTEEKNVAVGYLSEAYHAWADRESGKAWSHYVLMGGVPQFWVKMEGAGLKGIRSYASPLAPQLFQKVAACEPDLALSSLFALQSYDDWYVFSRVFVKSLARGSNWSKIFQKMERAKNNEWPLHESELMPDFTIMHVNFPNPYRMLSLRQKIAARWMEESPEDALKWYRPTSPESGADIEVAGIVLSWVERILRERPAEIIDFYIPSLSK